MKQVLVLLSLSLFTAYSVLAATPLASPAYPIPPECEQWAQKWKSLEATKDELKVVQVLRLLHTYPGEPTSPNIRDDHQIPAEEKVKLLATKASCHPFERLHAEEWILDSPKTTRDEREALFQIVISEIRDEMKNGSGIVPTFISKQMILNFKKNHTLALNDVESAEFRRILADMYKFSHESRLQTHDECDVFNDCKGEKAERTVAIYEYQHAEKERIQVEFSEWADAIAKNHSPHVRWKK